MEIKDIISSGLLEMFAMGIASAEERSQVEGWVRSYPEVAQELAAIEKSMMDMAFANSVKPADDVKSRIFSQINSNNGATTETASIAAPAKVRSISPVWQRVAAAAILLLLASAVLNVIYYKKYNNAVVAFAEKDSALQKKNEELLAQSEKVKGMDEYIGIVKNKYSQSVSLNGLDVSPNAAAKIYWIKNTGDVYIDPSDLPAAPQGKEYQFWGIVDGKPVDGGMIKTSNGGQFKIQKMKSFGKAQAFAVTLETAGGNPTPKGEMYVLGNL